MDIVKYLGIFSKLSRTNLPPSGISFSQHIRAPSIAAVDWNDRSHVSGHSGHPALEHSGHRLGTNLGQFDCKWDKYWNF